MPYSELVFPTLLEERCSVFSMVDSSFKLRKSKLGTGRAVMWQDGIAHTFTLESSFGGAAQGPMAGRHFGVQVIEEEGLGCRMQDAGCRMQGAGCRVQGAGCRVQVSEEEGKGSHV